MRDYVDIICRIRNSGMERKLIIEALAKDKKLKAKTFSYILQNQGSREDALSIFHDSIIFFVKKAFTQTDFELSSHVHAYLLGIAKNMWRNQLRKKNRDATYELRENKDEIDGDENQEELWLTKDRYELLKEVLNLLGRKCKEVLMYWASGYKMEVIADLLDYKTSAVARKKKRVCFKELTEIIKDRPDIKRMLQ